MTTNLSLWMRLKHNCKLFNQLPNPTADHKNQCRTVSSLAYLLLHLVGDVYCKLFVNRLGCELAGPENRIDGRSISATDGQGVVHQAKNVGERLRRVEMVADIPGHHVPVTAYSAGEI